MSGKPQNEYDHDQKNVRAEAVDQRRRRLTTGVAAAVPAFFILRHRSVRAGMCESMSGWNATSSMHPSSDHGQDYVCTGRSPGYWKNHEDAWPAPYKPGTAKKKYADGTLFYEVFAPIAHFTTTDPAPDDLTLMNVLRLQGHGDPEKMGAHLVAALLNAAAGKTQPVSVDRVKDVWQQWAFSGVYTPPPGVDEWYAEDIKLYLATTWNST